MHHYDVAAKVLIDSCRDEILRRFLRIDVVTSDLIEEIPQETVSVRRSDFPMIVDTVDRGKVLVILEIQSFWNERVPLQLLDYRIRHMLAQGLPALSAVLLLKPDRRATDVYQDEELRFGYRLIRLYEMDAEEALLHWPTCLLPFVPLMKNGLPHVQEVEERIYRADVSSIRKADMLTSMTILSGLISEEVIRGILSRRRDLMIESAAYELIRQEGINEGIQQGIQKGIVQGIEKGIEKGIEQGIEIGKIQVMRENVIDLLTIRFGAPSRNVIRTIEGIGDLSLLQVLKSKAMIAPSLRAFAADMKKMLR